MQGHFFWYCASCLWQNIRKRRSVNPTQLMNLILQISKYSADGGANLSLRGCVNHASWLPSAQVSRNLYQRNIDSNVEKVQNVSMWYLRTHSEFRGRLEREVAPREEEDNWICYCTVKKGSLKEGERQRLTVWPAESSGARNRFWEESEAPDYHATLSSYHLSRIFWVNILMKASFC